MKINEMSVGATVSGSFAPAPSKIGKVHKRTEEAVNPAQQAAIAVSMKKAGKKPKNLKEGQVKQLIMDLRELKDKEFMKKYGKSKEEMKQGLKSQVDENMFDKITSFIGRPFDEKEIAKDLGNRGGQTNKNKPAAGVVEGTVIEAKIHSKLVRILQQNGFKGPFEISETPWADQFGDVTFPEDPIMIQGTDVEYDAWVLNPSGDYGYYFGQESGYQNGNAQQVVSWLKTVINQGVEEGEGNNKDMVRLPPEMTGRDPSKPYVDIPGTSYTVSMRGDDAATQQDARHLGTILSSVPNPLTKAAGMAMRYAGQYDKLPTGEKVARAMDSAGNPDYISRYLQNKKSVKEQGVAEEKTRLDPKCWTGYKKQGTKMKGGVRVNNCVPKESVEESAILQGMLEARVTEDELLLMPGQGIRFKPELMPKKTDHEVEMARQQLIEIAQNAEVIYELIQGVSEMQGLDAWIQKKISIADDYMESVSSYLKGRVAVDEQVAGDRIDQALTAQYSTPQAQAKTQAIDQAFASGDEREFQRLGIQSPQQIERDYQTMLSKEKEQDAALMRNPRLTPSARPVQRYNPKGVPIREYAVTGELEETFAVGDQPQIDSITKGDEQYWADFDKRAYAQGDARQRLKSTYVDPVDNTIQPTIGRTWQERGVKLDKWSKDTYKHQPEFYQDLDKINSQLKAGQKITDPNLMKLMPNYREVQQYNPKGVPTRKVATYETNAPQDSYMYSTKNYMNRDGEETFNRRTASIRPNSQGGTQVRGMDTSRALGDEMTINANVPKGVNVRMVPQQGNANLEETDKESTQEKLHKRHQELRKKSGLPDPEYYRELKSTYDMPDDERWARTRELKKKYKVKEQESNQQDQQQEPKQEPKQGMDVRKGLGLLSTIGRALNTVTSPTFGDDVKGDIRTMIHNKVTGTPNK